MSQPTTSAVPEHLSAYAIPARQFDSMLLTSAASLGSALNQFRATQPEFIAYVPSIDCDIAIYARANNEVDLFVQRVADAFFAADNRMGVMGPFLPHVVTVDVSRFETILGGTNFSPLTTITGASYADWWQAVDDGSCRAGAGRYNGGGFIMGPDGRKYPMVVPSLIVNGEEYNANGNGFVDSQNISTLGGMDKGWTTIAVVSGNFDLRKPAPLWEKILAGFGGSTGWHSPFGDAAPGDVYNGLQVNLQGVPALFGPPPRVMSEPPPDDNPEPAERYGMVMRDGRLSWQPVGTMAGTAPQTAANSASLAITVLEGVDTAIHYDDASHSGYQVIYEVNDDGRRRAMVRSYQITELDGVYQLWPSYVSAAPDGTLERSGMHYFYETEIGPAQTTIGPVRAPYRIRQ